MFVLSGEYLNRYKKVKRVIKKQTRSSVKRSEALQDLYNIFIELEMTGGSLDEFMNLRTYTTDIIATLPKKNKYIRWGVLSGLGIVLISTIVYLGLYIQELQKYTVLASPSVELLNRTIIQWDPIEHADGYRIYVDGMLRDNIEETSYNLYHLDYARSYTIEVEAYSNQKYFKKSVRVPMLVSTPRKQSQVYDFGQFVQTLIFDDNHSAHVLISPNYTGTYRLTPSMMDDHYAYYLEDLTTQDNVLMLKSTDYFSVLLESDRVYELTVNDMRKLNLTITIALSGEEKYDNLENLNKTITRDTSFFVEYQNLSGEDQYYQYTGDPVQIRAYQGLAYEGIGHYVVFLDDNVIKIHKTATRVIFKITHDGPGEATIDFEHMTTDVTNLSIHQTFTLTGDPQIITHTFTGASDIIIHSGEQRYGIAIYTYDGTLVRAMVHSISATEMVYEVPSVYMAQPVTIVIFTIPSDEPPGTGPSTITIQPSV
ncbi:hypothetical protein N7548_01785 [Acholeplasma manati]|uniref:Fibronectin type-III domain-containing protein n=1 Tax=Paracholeplasma manati TaxID=591373 RepID=A0ABT2Y494_9MOLU|nr:hypothetical protein [Paracholeplasma manati]MCV2231560.1 hypothetical protein [Paracholeplasma manati]